MENNL